MSKKITNPMADIFKYLAISVLFMFIGFFIGQNFIPESVVYVGNFIMIAFMIGLLILAICSRKEVIPLRFSMNFVYAFAFIDGILMYPILQLYIGDLGPSIVMDILIGTIILFAVLSFISYKKQPGHYLGMGRMLFTGLIILLVLTIISVFLGGKLFNIGISILGILIFSGYILYDISLIKSEINNGSLVDKDDLSIHVLNLYLDFVNVFIDLLRLVWNLKS
ncbi:MAG: Bax inhibitor-1/YccA family protein [Peptostreptococcaceae bacterium]